MLWFETSTPDLGEARRFAEVIHDRFPGKLLAYNCSPSFNWRKHLNDAEIESFQRELGELGYRYQFITLAGFHSLNAAMYELAQGYVAEGMPAYVRLQEREFELEGSGYTATRHQREAGAGYFDAVMHAVSGGESSTLALKGSTEEEQFEIAAARVSPTAVEVVASADAELLTPDALAFVAMLQRELGARRRELLEAPGRAAARARRGRRCPTSCRRPRRSATATGASPRLRPTSQDRRVEITGPVERKMMINALNSGARVFMADFEDANSPTLGERASTGSGTCATRSGARSRSTPARSATA